MFDGLEFGNPAVPVLADSKDGLFRGAQLRPSYVLLEHKSPVGLANGLLLIKVPFLDSGFEHARCSCEPTALFENIGDVSQMMALDHVESLDVKNDIEPLLRTRPGTWGAVPNGIHD